MVDADCIAILSSVDGKLEPVPFDIDKIYCGRRRHRTWLFRKHERFVTIGEPTWRSKMLKPTGRHAPSFDWGKVCDHLAIELAWTILRDMSPAGFYPFCDALASDFAGDVLIDLDENEFELTATQVIYWFSGHGLIIDEYGYPFIRRAGQLFAIANMITARLSDGQPAGIEGIPSECSEYLYDQLKKQLDSPGGAG